MLCTLTIKNSKHINENVHKITKAVEMSRDTLYDSLPLSN